MRADSGVAQVDGAQSVIRVDGGMSASDWTMQFLADMLDAAGRPAGRPRDDRPGRGVYCRLAVRPLSRSGRIRATLASAAAFQPGDAAQRARSALPRMARRGDARRRSFHSRGAMHVVFRCDPTMLEEPISPDPCEARPARLAEDDASHRILGNAWPRGAHRQAMPAVRRCDVAWFHHPAAVRRPCAGWGAVVGLGLSCSLGRVASALAGQLPCTGASRPAPRSSVPTSSS